MIDEQQNPFGIFDVTADAYNSADLGSDEGGVSPDFYRPKLTEDVTEYKARLRFLPNIKDPSMTVISKHIYFFNSDPDDPEKSIYIDCTSNERGAAKNIITQAFFHLRNQEDLRLRALARNFSRKQYFWMLCYIMQDNVSQDEVGKVKILRYGKQINAMHKDALAGDPAMGVKSNVFYHPLQGRDFFLKIDKKTIEDGKTGKRKTITNYDGSKWDDQVTPFGMVTIDGNSINIKRISDTGEDRAMLMEFLKKESPDLSQVAYVPWDDLMKSKAERIVRTLVDNDRIFDTIYFKTYGKRPSVAGMDTAAPAQQQAQSQPQTQSASPATSEVISNITTDDAPGVDVDVDDDFSGMDLDDLENINLDDL